MSFEPAQDHTLQKKKRNQNKRNLWILFGVITFIVGAAMVVAFMRSMAASDKALQAANTTQTQSRVSNRAADTLANDSESTRLNSTAPASVDTEFTQSQEKKAAKRLGVSHIDSTDVLSGQTDTKLNTSSARSKVNDVTPEVDETQQIDSQPPQPDGPKPPSREEKLRTNYARLLGRTSYFPPEPEVQVHSAQFFQKYDGIGTGKNIITNVSAKNNDHYIRENRENTSAALRSASTQAAGGNPASTLRLDGRRQIAQSPDATPETPSDVRVLDMGEMTTGTTTRSINSDYKVDVFIHLAEVPLQEVRLKANFEFTEDGEGLLLRVNQLQFRDYIAPVNGYVIDIGMSDTPKFAHDVDTHFFQRFFARASAAFVAPWIDWVTPSTTTVVNGSVVVDNPSVTDTVDRIMGGFGNVAKEFLPDLAKNANRRATVKVPKSTPVGVVFSAPLYLPKGLFTGDEEYQDRKYENLSNEFNSISY